MGRHAGSNLILAVLGINLCLNLVQASFYNVGVKYHVTMNVFSGRDDPDWDIDDKDELYQEISTAVNSRPPTALDDDNLGYAGFTVQATNALGQTAWKTVGRHTSRTIESALLKSCPGRLGLSQNVLNHVNSAIIGQVQAPVQSKIASISVSNDDDSNISINIHSRIFGGRRKKRQAAMCATRFAPENWNFGEVQRRNNCYNYACNIQTNTFAQPGRGRGNKFTNLNSQEVYSACLRDGLTQLTTPNAGNECLIALVIWPGEDYHFYRLDNDGTWSHKAGRTPARNVDDSNMIITDPRTCDRGPYYEFAGFLGVGSNVYIR